MLSLNPKALLALSSVLVGGALVGCGGGGGGVSTPTPTPLPTSGPTPTPTVPGIVLADEFNSGSLDTSKWAPLDSTNVLQRTQFGNQPTFGQDSDNTRFMRVNFNTHLPNATNTVQFLGTEVAGKQRVPRGNGVEFQARMRLSNPERAGLVASFFMFGSKGNFGGTPPLSFDELDHELLTQAFTVNRPYTWTNIYNDFRVPQPGLEAGDSYTDATRTMSTDPSLTPGFDKAGWNLYRIVWRADQVQWFINDQLIRTDTSSRIPDDALAVRFNLWAAASPDVPGGWFNAYSPTLLPASTPAQNQTYSLDVDWVRVRALDSTTGSVSKASPLRLIPVTREEIMRGGHGAGYSSTKQR